MEQVSDDELDHGAEEDSDKEDQDLDKMFGAWLGELDKLTQVKKHTHTLIYSLTQVKQPTETKPSVSIATVSAPSLYPSNSTSTITVTRSCVCFTEGIWHTQTHSCLLITVYCKILAKILLKIHFCLKWTDFITCACHIHWCVNVKVFLWCF